MTTRECADCKQALPVENFYKHKPSRGGRRAVCRDCLRKRRGPHDEAQRNKGRRYRSTVQGRWVMWGKNLRSCYGIDQEDWARMFNAQGGKCAICARAMDVNGTGRDIHVDHDHDTGAVRELLCKPCNSLVGLCGEREAVLQRAIEYLRRHK